MDAQQFLEHIYGAYFEQTNVKRQYSEQILMGLKDSNPELLLQLCRGGFADKQLNLQTRQACSTLLKRCLSLYNPQRNDIIWRLCSLQARNEIKSTCVDQLIDQEVDIRRAAANTISEICAIELPRQEWPDLIPKLVSHTKNEQIQIRISAIMTLGYICEALKNHKQSGIQNSDAQIILMGICVGMDINEENLDIKLNAIKALQDSLYFMDQLFQQNEIRLYVKNLLIANATSNTIQIRIKALQCLIDFTKQLFPYVPEFLIEIFQCSSVSFEAEEMVSIPAIEIWNIVCAEIKEIKEAKENQLQPFTQQHAENSAILCLDFLKANYQSFIIPFMKNLLINNNDEEDDGEGLSIQLSSYKALSAIVELVGQVTHESVTTFISNTIKNTQWQYRKAGVLAFGALAEGPNSNEVAQLIVTALMTLMEALQDTNVRVKKAAAISLSKIAENYPQCFLQHQQAQQILQQLLGALSQQRIKVCLYIVWTLTYITENLDRYPNSVIQTDQLTILQYLSSTTIRNDIQDNEVNIIDTAFMGILNIIYIQSNQAQCKVLLMDFVNQILNLDKRQSEKVQHLQAGLLSAMHGCLVRLDTDSLSNDEIQIIFGLLVNCSTTGNSDQFYAIGGLASCLKRKFTPFTDQIIKLLNQPLQVPEDTETFKSALFCLADIARAIEIDFQPYIIIIDYLIKLIMDPNFNRDLKITVYNTIGDIVLGVKELAINYLESIKQVVKFGFSASIELTQLADPQSQEFAEKLKETLVAFYTCLSHAFCDKKTPFQPLAETIDWIFAFCEQMCDKKLKPTTEFARIVLNVIFDTANFYQNSPLHRKRIEAFLQSQFVIDLIKTLHKFKDQKEIAQAVEFACDLLKEEFNYQLQLDYHYK